MNTTLLFTIVFILFTAIIATIYFIYYNKEGFLHPHHPQYPWYWYNFPTRMYVPTRNMITDIRGDPRCPHFSNCGSTLRHSKQVMYPGSYYTNNLWYNPTYYPYYYDYYFPVPNFDYSQKYNIDGSLYKIKAEKINTAPSAVTN